MRRRQKDIMNKKILVVSIFAVFMLLAIAFASTVTSDTSKPNQKESPLYGIRTRRAIKEKIGEMLRRFVGERVFFLPFQWLRNKIEHEFFFSIIIQYTCYGYSCDVSYCPAKPCNL